MFFLCFGFLRSDLGSISLAAGTVPTRSRAMALTSLPISNFFLRGKHPPHRRDQHFRRKRLVQKHHTAGSHGFQRRHIHRITAGGEHAQSWIHAQKAGGQLLHAHAWHGGIEHHHRECRGPSLHGLPRPIGSVHRGHGISHTAQVNAHHFQQRGFVIYDQDVSAGSVHKSLWLYDRRMKFYTEYLTFKTSKHREYINITAQVASALHKSAIQEGMILVSAMHITAGVWVNDAEDGLIADIDEWLENLAPFRQDYRHHRTGESNGDSPSSLPTRTVLHITHVATAGLQNSLYSTFRAESSAF